MQFINFILHTVKQAKLSMREMIVLCIIFTSLCIHIYQACPKDQEKNKINFDEAMKISEKVKSLNKDRK